MSSIGSKIPLLIVLGVAVAWSTSVFALDPALDISEYVHSSWTVRQGFAPGRIDALAQTPDGYLWIGSVDGLYRFDGVRETIWRPPPGDSLPSNSIGALHPARDGRLWIGTRAGLVSWKNRKLTHYPELDGILLTSFAEDSDGTIWAGGVSALGLRGMLCVVPRSGSPRCEARRGEWYGALHLLRQRSGALWVLDEHSLRRFRGGTPWRFPMPGTPSALIEGEGGRDLLAASRSGLFRIEGDKVEPYRIPSAELPFFTPTKLLLDRNSGLWIGSTELGLVHIHDGRTDIFERSDGLSANQVLDLMEDREGNIWVATAGGLDKFSNPVAALYTEKQGLSSTPVLAVLPSRDGSLWLGTEDGVNRLKDGQTTVWRRDRGLEAAAPLHARAESSLPVKQIADDRLPGGFSGALFQDGMGRVWVTMQDGAGYFENSRFTPVPNLPKQPALSFAEDANGLMISYEQGLVRWGGWHVETTSWASLGYDEAARTLLADPRRGGFWLGFWRRGVALLRNGEIVRAFTQRDGLPPGVVYQLSLDPDGALWAATDAGFGRISNGRISTLTRANGLPCDSTRWLAHDDDGTYWLAATCGLMRVAAAEMRAWSKDPKRRLAFTFLDASDGVNFDFTPGADPIVAKAADNRIWFTNGDVGVGVIDPRHLTANPLPPPVHVEEVVADRKTYDAASPIRLPPLVRDLQIDYTALSFVEPEKVRFRYKLEGRDRGWRDPGGRRQAFYTDLPPGHYRFHVIAANNSGVWNTTGAALDFSIAPAFWQTIWFLVLCAAAILVLLWAAYQARLRQVTRAAAVARDTEARQHELRMQLAHANRLSTMGQLTASIAHEVNQPLAATVNDANAALRWLKAQPPELEEIREALAAIVRSGNRASEIVARILGMVRKAPAQEGEVDLNDEVLGVLAITRSEALKHDVAVRTELAPDLPAVRGDRVQLQQVLLNLIVNAIEAIGTLASGPRELVVRSEAHGDGVVVQVRDTGPGLEPDALERIFQPFYTSKSSGLGMGLAICASIIEAHGGQLSASANAPRGAVFQFTLPRERLP